MVVRYIILYCNWSVNNGNELLWITMSQETCGYKGAFLIWMERKEFHYLYSSEINLWPTSSW